MWFVKLIPSQYAIRPKGCFKWPYKNYNTTAKIINLLIKKNRVKLGIGKEDNFLRENEDRRMEGMRGGENEDGGYKWEEKMRMECISKTRKLQFTNS